MNGKRIGLLIFTILWYLATIALIVNFILGIVHGKAADSAVAYFLTYFVIAMVLCGWQMLVITLFGRLYGVDTYTRGGGRMNIIGIIVFIIIAPLTLIWHLGATLKPLWYLIRYSPEDFE